MVVLILNVIVVSSNYLFRNGFCVCLVVFRYVGVFCLMMLGRKISSVKLVVSVGI